MTTLAELLSVMECDTIEEAIEQVKADIRLSLEAAEAIKSAAGMPGNVWPSARERAFFHALCDQTTPPEVACNDDTRRLDALEKDVNEHGPLLLHNLRTTGNFRGLGLASTGRSLRKAIDDMSPPAASVPSPRGKQ